MKPTDEQLERTAATIEATKFFPAGQPHVREELLELLADMVGTSEQCEWLRKVFRDRITEWPGLAQVRAIFCTSHRPADGIEGAGYATVAGFTPGDIEREKLEAPPQKYLPSAGELKRIGGETAAPVPDTSELELLGKLKARTDAVLAKKERQAKEQAEFAEWQRKHEEQLAGKVTA